MRLVQSIALMPMIAVFIPAASAAGHSPAFPEGNHSPSTAYEIENPEKSWAIYTSLEYEDTGDYYSFTRASGERIRVSVILPESPSESGFRPSLAILGPGLPSEENVPVNIELPPGYGTLLLNNEPPVEAEFEPFTPGWYYELGVLDTYANQDGTYYVVVYTINHQEINSHEHRNTNYALVVGYLESFTLPELVLIPYSTQEIYSWEGQNRIIVFLPLVLVIIIGTVFLYHRSRRGMAPGGISKWLAGIGGMAFLGSAAGTIYQMSLALSVTGLTGKAVFTLFIAAVSIVLGITTLRYSLRSASGLNTYRRAGLILTGLIALFVWSGFYLGPVLVMLSAATPSDGLKQ